MKRVITQPQKSDMGSGFGVYEFEKGRTLWDFMQWYRINANSWGVISIYNQNNGECIRQFDYDLYDENICYLRVAKWVYDLPLKEITFTYCFMCEDVKISLGK